MPDKVDLTQFKGYTPLPWADGEPDVLHSIDPRRNNKWETSICTMLNHSSIPRGPENQEEQKANTKLLRNAPVILEYARKLEKKVERLKERVGANNDIALRAQGKAMYWKKETEALKETEIKELQGKNHALKEAADGCTKDILKRLEASMHIVHALTLNKQELEHEIKQLKHLTSTGYEEVLFQRDELVKVLEPFVEGFVDKEMEHGSYCTYCGTEKDAMTYSYHKKTCLLKRAAVVLAKVNDKSNTKKI